MSRAPRFRSDERLGAAKLNRLAEAADRPPVLLGAPPAAVPAVMMGRVVLVNGSSTDLPDGPVESFTYTVRVYTGDQGPARPGFTDLVGAAPEWRPWPDGVTVSHAPVGSLCLIAFVHGPEHGGEDTRGLVLVMAHEVAVAEECGEEEEPP